MEQYYYQFAKPLIKRAISVTKLALDLSSLLPVDPCHQCL